MAGGFGSWLVRGWKHPEKKRVPVCLWMNKKTLLRGGISCALKIKKQKAGTKQTKHKIRMVGQMLQTQEVLSMNSFDEVPLRQQIEPQLSIKYILSLYYHMRGLSFTASGALPSIGVTQKPISLNPIIIG